MVGGHGADGVAAVVGLVEVLGHVDALKQDMAVAEGGLLAVVGDEEQLDGGICHHAGVLHQRVLGARLVVSEHTHVLQVLHLQATVHVLRRAVSTELHGGVGSVVAVVDVALQSSVHIVVDGAVHVAEEVFAHLHGELAHVELAEGEATVGDVVVEVVGIHDEGGLLPVDGTAAAAVAPHVDIAYLVDVVLHRQLRQRVNHHLLGIGRLVLLVEGVVVGEHRVKDVALHVVVGEGILVEHLCILAGEHVLLDGVVFLVGFHVQPGLAVERGHLEDEAAAARLLHRAYNLALGAQLGLNHHLALQPVVVDAQRVVGPAQGAVFIGDYQVAIAAVVARLVPGVAHDGILILTDGCPRVVGIFLDVGLPGVEAYAVLPAVHLVGLYGVDGQHLEDLALDGERALGRVAKLMAAVGQFLPLVLAPALHHHQQVQVAAVQVVVFLEVVGGIGDEAAQLAAEQQVGHQVAVVVGRLVGIGVADGEREQGGLADTLQLHGNLDALVGVVGLVGHDGRGDEGTVVLVVVDEEQAVAEYLPVAVEEGHVGHAAGQLVHRDGEGGSVGGGG